MSEKEIQQYHEDLFIYLYGAYQKDEKLRFGLRTERIDLLKKGYWFYGEDEIDVSFWEEEAIPADSKINLHLSARAGIWHFSGSNIKVDQLKGKEAVNLLEKYSDGHISYDGSNLNFSTKLRQQGKWLNTLKIFVDNIKPLFDQVFEINKNKQQEHLGQQFIQQLQNTLEWHAWFQENIRLNNIKAEKLPRPVVISRLSVSHFQGIRRLAMEQIPLERQWVFITGENGFGKTSVLRAIAKGLTGDADAVSRLSTDTRIFINGLLNRAPFSQFVQTNTTPEVQIPLVAYGVSRFQTISLGQEDTESSRSSVYSLFNDNGQLKNIERLLIDAELDDKPLFRKLVSVFKAIIPAIKDIKSEREGFVRRVFYTEQDDHGETYQRVTLPELAAGYRGILTMIGDMILRLADGKDNFDDLGGIVLIDEFDAHLHPRYQYELPQLLSKVFPKVQFIVTTHSPIPMLGLPKKNSPVVLTVSRNAKDGIQIERLDDDIDIRRLTPEALLTSPVFGFQHMFARDAADEIIPNSNYDKVMEVDQIRERLRQLREKGMVQ